MLDTGCLGTAIDLQYTPECYYEYIDGGYLYICQSLSIKTLPREASCSFYFFVVFVCKCDTAW